MVTITDIAVALGVTPSTVSRALSGNPRVREKTRLAVLRKAEEMGYERNILASNLRKGRSNIVGMVLPRIHSEFYSNVTGGVESVLGQAGYGVMICQTLGSREAETKAVRNLRDNRVAGIIISHAIEDDGPEHLLDIIGDTPIVQFDRVFDAIPGAKIKCANFEGAYIATKHLIEAGYRRIGAVAGFMTSEAYALRLEGYKKALIDAALPYDESIVYLDSVVRETGYEAGIKALEAGCDALYSSGAFSALGAIEALKGKGVKIPEEFGIVGTSNEEFTALMTPSMSTLSQHPFEMGEEAARAFLQGREDTRVIPMELIIRQSSNRNLTGSKII